MINGGGGKQLKMKLSCCNSFMFKRCNRQATHALPEFLLGFCTRQILGQHSVCRASAGSFDFSWWLSSAHSKDECLITKTSFTECNIINYKKFQFYCKFGKH